MATEKEVAAEFLSRVPIFSSLKPDDFANLPINLQIIERDVGQIIFREGDEPLAMYVVRSGKVAVSVWTADNEELTLSSLGPGDFFGEVSLFDGSRRTATIKAVEPVELLEIGREDFFNLLRVKPDIAFAILNVMASRLRNANQLIQGRAARNANQEIERQSTFAEKVADKIAELGGSWSFIFGFLSLLGCWMLLNSIELIFNPFDPYPFIFLNFILGVVAALQAPIIMMSQNREAQKDRLRADLDYQVNLKSELQIESLHAKLDTLRASEISELCKIQRRQMEILDGLTRSIVADDPEIPSLITRRS
jgi:uncharacterized membrane protein